MPKLSPADDEFLRKIMLPRAPGCVYTREDVELIIQERGIDAKVIDKFAKVIRWRKDNNGLGSAVSVEDYLSASINLLSEKVISLQLAFV